MKILHNGMIDRLMVGVAALMCLSASGASLEEARVLAEDGNLTDAIAMLIDLEAENPKDAAISKELGDLCRAAGRESEALQAYTNARKRGSKEAVLGLAELAVQQYRVDDARTLLSEYRAGLKKGKKVIATDESGDLDDRIDRVENMLDRVEQIEVIDSMVVNADDFFRHYRLSPESGSLNGVDVLPQGFKSAAPTVVYEPESGRQMIWSAPGKDGNFELVSSAPLYGGEWEKPVSLGSDLGDGGDANYPFLMPDGVTLYFANDGENSLGGLDIFISRKGDDEFLQPQNLGMPYNSPYDDYMLAIDEITGVGWFASDRNQIPGKVTIYVFIPQELRKNVPTDAPDLLTRARLSNIRDTWNPSTDRDALMAKIGKLRQSGDSAEKPEFEIYIPGKGVLTTYTQLSSPNSRQAMRDYLEGMHKLSAAEEQLAKARLQYGQGNTSAADLIKRIEKQLPAARNEVIELRNRVIELEVR